MSVTPSTSPAALVNEPEATAPVPDPATIRLSDHVDVLKSAS